MTSPMMRFAMLVGLAFVPSGAMAQQPDAIKAAFVVLGPDNQAIARVITRADACPTLRIDGADVSMGVRAKPETVAQRTTRSAPEDSKPSDFPVLVCESILPSHPGSVMLGDRSLPLPKDVPNRIIVVGDTGCRMKKSDNAFQPCNDPVKWPWKAVADRAAKFNPDLVIHTGDIHYRENACPEGLADCAGSPWGYGFDAFDEDLFKPAARLLASAPWIFVRGNHESCDRAGQGWWRFLDPHPLQPGQDCNLAANDSKGDFSDPYAVSIAADTQLIVFDSSKTGTKILSESDPVFVTYKAQVDKASAIAAKVPHSIFMNHHPILGLAPNIKPGKESYYPGNEGMQSVMEKAWPKLLFPPNVNALFSGHIHVFQMTSFSTPHPTQFISGNAGSWVDEPNFESLPQGASTYGPAVIDQFTTTNQYGFMTMERVWDKNTQTGADWVMREWDVDGRLLTTCLLSGSKGKCDPSKLVNGGH